MCNHIFEGRAGGVTCILCGYHMTAAEYAEYIKPPKKPEAPKRTRKKKEVTTNG